MDITFTCPHCGEVTLIGQEFVGQSGECRACGREVTVPPVTGGEKVVDSHSARPKRDWGTIVGYVLLVLFFLLALSLLLPAGRYARPTARRMSSGNNLKQIALAMLNYDAVYKQLPRAYYLNADGERILSWRVALLPFIEKQELSDRYKPEEPWNSTANLEVSKARISPFEQPNKDNTKSHETGYMVITGPGTLFEEGKDISLADITDGAANTILAVEVTDSGVNWAQPVDLDIRSMIFKINSGGFGISGPWKGGAMVAFADGSVRLLEKETLESTLKAMITRAGGETIDDY